MTRLENGGNNDGIVNSVDAIFTSLRLWQDHNRNGVSESQELYPLVALNVQGVGLDYKEMRRMDRHGNGFRYRARIYDAYRGHGWQVDVRRFPRPLVL